ncbi:MAG TPA: hypothetical protein DEE98_02905 [Elusimicrobia bacterium]|nr:MAG: hypothetical protein A2278_07735 [Elusimicrobia bacterium RIFOXYA12_FULL_49_49]OGS09407.1 MAG: hypothetical protein A2386_07965 [Elusimicrobia bacterium RIFOXYB1_FULL_48_9]OGS16045.1 MAG: hypothetical protein A2251_02530 [Elusimicrobia bacterium RIFOXYA2_FULL_47_53]OGS25784.1 MAG: hypothetical protein A2339_05105 [Elusimicrobia bacterium RIFOXYB12_FULL_50_12]OGS30203.1 MAG: hypothetical protein A2323_02005 [Elusimicrobia bacterium RIFOXYB2_FULL_46_23]HBU69313.1 hypothetical protein [El
MKKLIISIIFLFLSGPVYCAFDDIDIGPIATSLGGACYAKTNDIISGVFYNPAGLVGIMRKEISASHEKLLYGLSDNSSIARSLVVFGSPLSLGGNYLGNMGIGWNSLSLDSLYREDAIKLNYAYSLRHNLLIGFGVSNFMVTYGNDEYTMINPVFDNGYSKTAMGVDLGLIYTFRNNVYAGVSAQNINEPDLGLKYVNAVDRKINIGLGLHSEAAEYSMALVAADGDTRAKFGAEIFPFKNFFKKKVVARGGFNFGSRDYRNASIGFGYQESNYELNYSFLYPLSGIANTIGSHQIGLSFRWGQAYGGDYDMRMSSAAIARRFLNDSRLAFRTPGEISPHSKRIAKEIMILARNDIAKGSYSAAHLKIRQVNEILLNDKDTNEMLSRIVSVVEISSSVAGSGKRNVLIRKGVDKFINKQMESAADFFVYASQLWPGDRVAAQFKNMIFDKAPEATALKNTIPGITVVDQMLQDALDLIRTGRFISAVNYCERVLELEPNNITALTRMGSAYWAIGKKELARKAWETLLEIDPENEEVREFLRRTE